MNDHLTSFLYNDIIYYHNQDIEIYHDNSFNRHNILWKIFIRNFLES